jgi:serine/threonine protein kinase/WD40 repeat protein/Flp pilus assembly protein TadD
MNEQEIFEQALDKHARERASFLDDACGDDRQLRQRVEDLLRIHDGSQDFFEKPAAEILATIDPPITEKPGTQIGPYKLLQQIGEGGMGVVYMAEQSEPVERRVALKIIKPGMDTGQVIARFEAEEQALAMMDHPNIAKVLDAGTTDSGRPYFVMEIVKGIPITRYCDEQHLTPKERLELFVPICHAVQHAHQKGIIHRDIKPSNILVALYDGQPVPKVIDFGVAKATSRKLTEKTMFTQYGQIVGTLEYMSPEQANLNQLDIDTRSDIYSLGVLLYELLTGETPFDKEQLRSAAFEEMLRIIREEEPPRPSFRLSTIDTLPSVAANRKIEPKKLSTLVRGELDWIVMKALEKDRARRYETATGFANDIQRYLNDEAVVACPPSAAYRFRKFARRNKRLLGTIASVGSALLLGTIVSTWLAIYAMRSLRAEQQARQAARQAEHEAKRQLFDTYVAQARASRWSGCPGQRLDAMDAVTKAAILIEPLGLGEDERLALRNQAIAAMTLADLRTEKTWKGRSNGTFDASFSRDLQLVVSGGPGEPARIRRVGDPATDVELTRATNSEFYRFDPTNRYLLGFPPLHVIDISDGKVVLTCSSVPGIVAADFDAQGCVLAVGDTQGVIRLFDMTSHEEMRRFSIGSGVHAVKFSPDGRRLAVSRFDDTFEIRDVATGEADFLGPKVSGIGVLAWRPDGAWLAVVQRAEIHVFELRQPDGKNFVCRGHQSRVVRLEFHPDGQLLGSTSWDGTTRVWDTGSGQQLLRVEGHFDRFSPDGRLLAFRQGLEVGFWQVSVPMACRWLHGGWTIAVAVGPRGRLLAVTYRDGVRLWDLERLEQVAHLPIGDTRDVVFHPANGSLVTSGPRGLYRWPVETESEGSVKRLRLGPPIPIDSSLDRSRTFEFSRNGRTLVAEGFFQDKAFIIRADGDARRRIRLARSGLENVALSPDGNWVATSSPLGVAIWNARSGEHVRDLAVPGKARMCFTPNSRWLVSNSGPAVGLWEVGTWKLRYDLPFKADVGSAVAFTSDGRVAAVGLWGVGIQLIEVETGKPIAMLEVAHRPPVYSDLAFTPDGDRLAASADYLGLCIWDLRAIRSRLAEMGLDWDRPPFPEAELESSTAPLNVEVDLGSAPAWPHLANGRSHYRSQRWQEVIRETTQAIELVPEDPEGYLLRAQAKLNLGELESALADLEKTGGPHPYDAIVDNSVAWSLVVRPERGRRYAQLAIAWAQRAVELEPQRGTYWNTLGVAHYRAGNWDEALAALAKSDRLLEDEKFSFNAFFLAMVHWQKGKHEEAQAWYGKSVTWMDEHMPQDAELRSFREEAIELIGKSHSVGSETTEKEDDQAEKG